MRFELLRARAEAHAKTRLKTMQGRAIEGREQLISRPIHIHLHSLAYHLHSLVSLGYNSDISADTTSLQTFHHVY